MPRAFSSPERAALQPVLDVSELEPWTRFGTVYGSMLSVMALAGIVGPLAAGMSHDLLGSYLLLLWVGLGLAILSALLLAMLDQVRSGE